MSKIITAIDGFSSCGKSTLARALAQALNYIYIDSGAMYRAVTFYFLQEQIPIHSEEAVRAALPKIHIGFEQRADRIHTLLNGQDVEGPIREMAVSGRVSEVAAISSVRRAMVAQQQRMGQARGIVMDGRDIGTVVFPNAALKIFLKASREERVRRRFEELRAKGLEVSRESVRANLDQRDHIDSTREDSPLRQAVDAVVIDNTNLTEQEQLAMTLALAKERIRRDRDD